MITPWTKKKERIEYTAYGRGSKTVWYGMPDGETRDFVIGIGSASVGVLALTESETVLLARQYRPGPGRVLDEIVGGAIDPDESPEIAAARELREETGYVGEITYVGQMYADGYSEHLRHYCIARGCVRVGEQQLDAGEFVDVVEYTLDALRSHVRSGAMTDVGGVYMCLDYLDRTRGGG